MNFYLVLLAMIAVGVYSWQKHKKDGGAVWENVCMTSIMLSALGGLMLIFVHADQRGKTDRAVERHPELLVISKALPAIREASPVEYAKYVTEIDELNKLIDSAKGSSCSNWFDWFVNDKLESLPKIEIR